MGLYDRVDANGSRITRQHRILLHESARAVGIDPARLYVTQGSWSQGSLSGGTHAASGALDLRTWNLPADKLVALVVEMRRRGAGATWVRSRRFGWDDGDHIHSLVGCGDAGDDPFLSASAQRQVAAWKRGTNGLANGAPDPHPRPAVWPLVEWSGVGYGKRGADVLLVQKALARYVGLDYSSGPGVWGARTQAAWLRASVKARRKGIDLLAFLGYRYGFRPAR